MAASWRVCKVKCARLDNVIFCQYAYIIIPHWTRNRLIAYYLHSLNKINNIVDKMKANEELFSDEKILGCREFRAHYTLVPSCIIIWIINAETNCNIYVDVSYSKTNLTIWNI